MKKRLFILPLMAGLVLTGCEITLFGKTIKFGKDKEDEVDLASLPENFKLEYEGYKMATSLKDGGRYILGTYRINEDVMRFADGNYHSDIKDGKQCYYSFYLGTTEDTSEAAVIEAKALGNDEFSLKMICEGKPWHNKYIGVYNAVSEYSNDVMSIAPLDELNQKQFEVHNKDKVGTVTALTQTHFKYYGKYNDSPACTVAAMYLHQGVDEEEVPKFIGTGHNKSYNEPDYTSMDCKSYDIALELEEYDLAHLYEKA